MVMNVLLVLVAAVAVFLVYAAMRPDTFRVERHVVIDRPAEEIFPLIDDFHAWRRWSPWEDLDPALRRTYGGAERGKGAVYEWGGNSRAGTGRMEIVRSDAPTHVTIELAFIKPFRAENASAFDLEAQGSRTAVSWAIYGPLPFISKVMGVFVSMDRLMGKDFERGLARLKAVAEAPPAGLPQ
ncbi:MAG: polyketide cyclase [Acidobacteria bacterium SCN 69-37]|nr:MAG: polyketide cyclase [Acidobacteria bacterium SCN 69-37]